MFAIEAKEGSFFYRKDMMLYGMVWMMDADSALRSGVRDIWKSIEFDIRTISVDDGRESNELKTMLYPCGKVVYTIDPRRVGDWVIVAFPVSNILFFDGKRCGVSNFWIDEDCVKIAESIYYEIAINTSRLLHMLKKEMR